MPPGLLVREAGDITAYDAPLWRIHPTIGPHARAWDDLRAWGPAADCRWEPHPEPVGIHDGEGVMYAATDLATAVVETFHKTGRIDPSSGRPKGTSWSPTRPLRLLNLTDDWALRNGASASLTSAPQSTCRSWARVIRRTWPDLDGLCTPSTLTGRNNVTLWAPAADTFPDAGPAFCEYLADDLLWSQLDHLARRYETAGFRLI